MSAIGFVNVSETSTPSYTVTLALGAGDAEPRIGATADASVKLTTAADVLTVPTSAVTLTGTAATVSVLRDGTPTAVDVTTGAVGSERTEITDGLVEGDTVVLADLNAAISSDEESASTGLTGLGGSTSEFPSRSNVTGGGGAPAPPGS
ncbi:hypothetical protein [Microbacterium sp. GXF0217]